MGYPLYMVDAFASAPFGGNPAAVVFLDQPREEKWMQNVAAEMRHGATAFLVENGEKWDVRWFTPLKELPLCGHATLASAHAIWDRGLRSIDSELRFVGQVATLACRKSLGGIDLDLPPRALTDREVEAERVVEALRLESKPRRIASDGKDILVEVESEEVLRGIKPDFAKMQKLDTFGVTVTSIASGNFDFVSRFFAPSVGCAEDPATGSIHALLGPYWSKLLGRDELRAYQCSERGGSMILRMSPDCVTLTAKTTTFLIGTLLS